MTASPCRQLQVFVMIVCLFYMVLRPGASFPHASHLLLFMGNGLQVRQ